MTSIIAEQPNKILKGKKFCRIINTIE
jgi:hypothetical protein